MVRRPHGKGIDLLHWFIKDAPRIRRGVRRRRRHRERKRLGGSGDVIIVWEGNNFPLKVLRERSISIPHPPARVPHGAQRWNGESAFLRERL